MSRAGGRQPDGGGRLPRRALLTAPLALLPLLAVHTEARDRTSAGISLNPIEPAIRFSADDLSTVGIYDTDWLLTPPFGRMLDLMARSRGGISGVRFFGIFSSGTRELLEPVTGGVVWVDPNAPPDFTIPFAALEALTVRGLTPFIALGFFPPAVSPDPIVPPESPDRWHALVSAFLTELAADPRFGPDAISTWRFEVWNEPNEGRFWRGTFQQYLDLYAATADAVGQTGLAIRLGGPAMAYKPESEAEDGPDTLITFLEFLRSHPRLQCDFVSYHRKGTVDGSPPDPRRLWHASAEVERLVREIVPDRMPGLELINNEADEKIGFESPYAPRMDAFATSWLSTLAAIDVLRAIEKSGHDEPARHRFFPDNANLQLMAEPFDGRRSIYVPFSNSDRTRLVKTAGAIWYDLLPILEGDVLAIDAATQALFPDGDLYVMATRTERSCALLVTWFPASLQSPSGSRAFEIEFSDVRWDRINIVEYRIDSAHSNSYAAAGGSPETPVPDLSDVDISALRLAQELTVRDRTERVVPDSGRITVRVELEPFATACLWLTDHDPGPIEPPSNVRLRAHSDELDLLWNEMHHGQLLGYEAERIDAAGRSTPLTNRPIRPTLVSDSRPYDAAGHRYRVRAVSCSNVRSDWAWARPDDSEAGSLPALEFRRRDQRY
ncbi:MAG: hypothetical protein IT335_07855 [Thermomicrobiales bacterium]|nr:hypothetical protein [Thermomicrobiales bacterium]